MSFETLPSAENAGSADNAGSRKRCQAAGHWLRKQKGGVSDKEEGNSAGKGKWTEQSRNELKKLSITGLR